MNYKIFINYRRADAKAAALALHNQLERKYGKQAIFLDTQDIHSGEDWAKKLRDSGNSAKVLLVLIGKDWLGRKQKGKYRIQEDGDWVRAEIRQAIDADLTLIPVLIDNAELPTEDDLPKDIRKLLTANAAILRTERYTDDFNALDKQICLLLHSKLQCSLLKNRLWILIAFLLASLFGLYQLIKPPADPCPEFPNDRLSVLVFNDDNIGDLGEQIPNKFTQAANTKLKVSTAIYKEEDVPYYDMRRAANACNAQVAISTEKKDGGRISYAWQIVNESIESLSFNTDLENEVVMKNIHDIIGKEALKQNMNDLICFLSVCLYKSDAYKRYVKEDYAKSCTLNEADIELTNVITDLQTDALILDEQYEQAWQKIETRESNGELDKDFYVKKAKVAEKLGKSGEAAAAYTKVLNFDYYHKEAVLEKRGDQFYKLENFQQARDDYKKASDLKPNDTKVKNKFKKTDSEIKVRDEKIRNTELNSLKPSERLTLAREAVNIGEYRVASNLLRNTNPSTRMLPEYKMVNAEIQLATGQSPAFNAVPLLFQDSQRIIARTNLNMVVMDTSRVIIR